MTQMTPPENDHTQTRLPADVLAHAAMYRCIAENTTDLIIRYDAGRNRTYVSPSVRSVLGFEPDELLRARVLTAGQERPTFFTHPDDSARLAAAIASVGPDRRNVRISGRICRKDGVWIWLEGIYCWIAEDGGLLAVLRDMTEQNQAKALLAETNAQLEAANRALRDMANQDGLTGLANRRRLDEILLEEFSRARREQAPLGLVMIDIDRFKAYNDLYGHQAGDDCLRRVARAIRDAMRRPGDKVARYGGEEMTAVLPGTDGRGAAALAEVMRCAVAREAIVHRLGEDGIVTVSAGVSACVPGEDELDPAVLVSVADRALYQAKADGRNCVRRIR
jgi:diguanylate cyclase (GGDEF)-like protein/PAS domain S-box-containing protein